MSQDTLKLLKAVIEARKAFWEEIDGDTDLPSGFGVQINGYAWVFDEDLQKQKLVRETEQSIGQELQKKLDELDEENDEGEKDG
jgi:hypothetical protein